MDWKTLLYEIIEICIIPLLGILTAYAVKIINVKSGEIQNKIKNDNINKYVTMLNDTISACVVSTYQTYVSVLKKENAFTAEAQKEAFKITFDAVKNILTDDAKKYLIEAYGDLDAYITNKIENEVSVNKIFQK